MSPEGADGPARRPPFPVSRVEALVDGTFVVAMTILTLGVGVPTAAEVLASGDLGTALLAVVPRLVALVLAFLGMCAYWMILVAHGRLVVRYDLTLVGIIVYLLLAAILMPFTTALLGTYPDEFLSVALFTLNQAILFALTIAHWEYIARHPALLQEPIEPRYRRLVSIRTALPGTVFVATLLVAWWDPRVAYYGAAAAAVVWTAPGLTHLVYYRRKRRW